MKNLLRRVSTLLIVMLMATLELMAATKTYTVNSANVDVRQAPSTGATMMGKITKGETVEVFSIFDGWAEVKYKNDSGFVQAEYLDAFVPVAEVTAKQEAVSNSPVKDDAVHVQTATYNAQNASGAALANSHNDNQHAAFQNEHKNSTTETAENDRKTSFWHIGYFAGSFDCIKITSNYGIGWINTEKEIAPNLFIGANMSFNINAGFVSSHDFAMTILFGPALGYNISEDVYITLPVDAMCEVKFEQFDKHKKDYISKTKSHWGAVLTPSVFLGKKYGIYVGPMLSIPFSKGEEVSCGFTAGIYF